MKTVLLAAALACFAGLADAQTFSRQTQGSCTRADGAIRCQSHSVTTGPGGATGQRDRATVILPGQVTTSVQGVRLNGRSFSRHGVITR